MNVRLWTPAALVIILAAVLVVTSLGIFSVPVAGAAGTTSLSSFSGPTVAGSVAVGAFSKATPVSPEFWGINVEATDRFNSADAASVATTPVSYIRFPGGRLGEELNYTSGIITDVTNGAQTRVDTTTATFVAACKQISCHAIMQLPAEIDKPSTAAYYAAYVVRTLGYQPAYWEIGNDPAGWTHFGAAWSAWKNGNTGNITPAPFATLVQSYIKAVLAVDPAAKFLALGAGVAGTNYAKAWVEDLARVDGHQLSGISVHSYSEGGPSNPTDTELFANLNGLYSVYTQVTTDQQYISEACPNCTNLGVFVTEINAAENSPYTGLLTSFAGTLYLAADAVEGLASHASNLDWFCYDCGYNGAWSKGPEKWQMQYYLFTDLMPHLDDETLPTTVTGPSTFYGMTTYNGSGLALLLVNVNTTTSVDLNLSGAGFSPTASLRQYLWVNGTPLPVQSQLPAGKSIDMPPLSIAVLVGPLRSDPATYPVVFTESGLPSGSEWSVTLNGDLHTSTSSSIDFSEVNGTYSYTVQPPAGYLAASGNGSVVVSGAPVAQPVAFTPKSSPVFVTTFIGAGLPVGAQWSVALNGTNRTTTSTTIAFWEENGTYAFITGSVPGYLPIPTSGSIGVNGSAVDVYLTYLPVPTNSTVSNYSATFSENGLASSLQWSVTIGTTSLAAGASAPVVFRLSNGTFAFTLGTVPGYSVNPATGWITVDGAGTTVVVTYLPIPSTPPSNDSSRISTVEGGVMDSNGSAVAGLGLSLIFRGGAGAVEWLNLTTDSSGRFIASGLNLSGNLSAVKVDSPEYQVTFTNVAWHASDAVNVTVVLQTVPIVSTPGGHPQPISVISLVIIGLAVTLAILCGAVVQAARRDRRMARYRKYFANPPR
jgi:hypothetical protein